MNVKLWVATKAFLNYKGKILILRESKKYEDGTLGINYGVPGGRVQPGQKWSESLLREIKEETGLLAKIGRPFYVDEWRPVVRGEQWQIVGTFFECFADSDTVDVGVDHDDYQWIDPEEYNKFNLTDNLVPAFQEYLKLK